MAHWAEIDKNNLVVRVLVFADDKTKSWIQKRFGGTWVQTSYSGEIRKRFAGVGYSYDKDKDEFTPPMPEQPYASWTFNEDEWLWESPIERPTDGKDYRWDEETTSWVEILETSE